MIDVPGPLITRVFNETEGVEWEVTSSIEVMGHSGPPSLTVRDLGQPAPLDDGRARREHKGGCGAAHEQSSRGHVQTTQPEATRFVSNTAIGSAALHGEKFAILDTEELGEIESSLRRAFVKASKMVRNMPIGVIAGPRQLVGTWGDWAGTLRVRQLELFAAELSLVHCPIMRPFALAAATRLAEATRVRGGVYAANAHMRLGEAAGAWLGDLVAWAVEQYMDVSLPVNA